MIKKIFATPVIVSSEWCISDAYFEVYLDGVVTDVEAHSEWSISDAYYEGMEDEYGESNGGNE